LDYLALAVAGVCYEFDYAPDGPLLDRRVPTDARSVGVDFRR
jgi:hypothetical protein